MPAPDDLAREPPAAVVVGHREHRARVPSVSSPRSTSASTSSGARAGAAGWRRSASPCRPARELAERELELVQQQRVGARLLDRRELLARDVLDQAEQQRVAVVGLAHERRHGRDAGLARRAPAALAGDQLEAAGRRGPHDDRLDEPLRANRVRERRVASWSKRLRGWRGFAWIVSTGRCASSGSPGRRPAARGRGRGRGASQERPTSSIATFQYASAPAERGRRRHGQPWLGASATRTERGTEVGRRARRSAGAPRRDVRGEARAPVDHRQDHAAEREPRVEPRADELDRADELREPSSA
jgi:hypothetical protein